MAQTRNGPPSPLDHGTVVVKAWAPWCQSCRALAPLVDDVAAATGLPVIGVRVDTDPDTVERLGIRSVPTLVGLRDGAEVGRLVGLQSTAAVESLFSATSHGTGTVSHGPPAALLGARLAAGTVVAGAGLATGTIPLLMIGAGLGSWALVGLVRR